VIGSVPVHVPGCAVSVWPSWAVPLIVGFAVFCGAACARAPAPETTPKIAVAIAVASAVTSTRRLS
jgi:hypothetical protein